MRVQAVGTSKERSTMGYCETMECSYSLWIIRFLTMFLSTGPAPFAFHYIMYGLGYVVISKSMHL